MLTVSQVQAGGEVSESVGQAGGQGGTRAAGVRDDAGEYRQCDDLDGREVEGGEGERGYKTGGQGDGRQYQGVLSLHVPGVSRSFSKKVSFVRRVPDFSPCLPDGGY